MSKFQSSILMLSRAPLRFIPRSMTVAVVQPRVNTMRALSLHQPSNFSEFGYRTVNKSNSRGNNAIPASRKLCTEKAEESQKQQTNAKSEDAKKENGKAQEASEQKSNEAESQSSGAELTAKVAELQKQLTEKAESVKKLTDENLELRKRSLTALADVENMRVRMNNKAEEDRRFAVRSFAKGMLEVADCLERALESMPEDKRKDNQDLALVYEGVSMTDRIFHKGLEAHGIKKFDPKGEKFDPNLHQALFELPAEEGQDKGLVGAVVKQGYMIHDRVLRPSEVGVTK